MDNIMEYECKPFLFVECSSCIKQENIVDVPTDLSTSDVGSADCQQAICDVIDIPDNSSDSSSPIVIEDDDSPMSQGFKLSGDLIQRLESIANTVPSKIQEKNYTCSLCGVSSSFPRKIIKHQSKCWGKNNRSNAKKPERKSALDDSSTLECRVTLMNGCVTYCCEICDFISTINCEIKKHYRTSHNQPKSCDVCGKVFLHHGYFKRHFIKSHSSIPSSYKASESKSVQQPLLELQSGTVRPQECENNSINSSLTEPNEHCSEEIIILDDIKDTSSPDESNLMALKKQYEIEIVDIQDRSNV